MSIKKILLVDDDAGANFLNRIYLNNYNVVSQIDTALNGREAIDYLAASNECPDIILLDINMPVLDGFEFLKIFNEQNKCSTVSKIFMLTSSTREEDRIAAMSSKYVKGYFDKPLTTSHIEEMFSLVNTA